MNLRPQICNLCGGRVIFINNKRIYGKSYGSGKCYLCTKCGAYVGTHKNRPHNAMGILANKEMRDMKIKCHELFDKEWKKEKNRPKARKAAYKNLAHRLGIKVRDCHFGYFDLPMLNKVYELLKSEMREK